MSVRLIALCTAVVLLATTLAAGCDGRRGLEPTNQLVIYYHENMSYFMDLALRTYKMEFPDVQLTTKIITNYFGEEWYGVKMKTELMAGKGSDLILYTMEFNEKVYETGIFYDLHILMEQDSDFDYSLYVESVLDAGLFKGKRYTIPLSYYMNTYVTSEETMETFGVQFHKDISFTEFTGQILHVLEAYPEWQYRTIFHGFNSLMFDGKYIFLLVVCGCLIWRPENS